MKQVFLKSKHDRRVRHGHVWIYANEIDTKAGDYASLEVGECANVLDSSGKQLASAYFNRNTLMVGRIYSRQTDILIVDLLARRLQEALDWRESCFSEPFYRLVYGDGDGLPGLVVDRFNDVLVIQITTAGMYRILDEVVKSLVALCKPTGILLKNDSAEEREGLAAEVRVLFGNVNEEVAIKENETTFIVKPFSGQKTGWFFDHRESRARVRQFARNKRVLDLFSYVGGWGLQMLTADATSLIAVDRSKEALALLEQNGEKLSFASRLETRCANAVDALKQLKEEGQKFDLVIVDPPAFIKRRKDAKAGLNAYRQINQLAAQLLDDDGLLVSASCSLHLQREQLIDVVKSALYKTGRQAAIVAEGALGADHPTLAAVPEMNYLKMVMMKAVG